MIRTLRLTGTAAWQSEDPNQVLTKGCCLFPKQLTAHIRKWARQTMHSFLYIFPLYACLFSCSSFLFRECISLKKYSFLANYPRTGVNTPRDKRVGNKICPSIWLPHELSSGNPIGLIQLFASIFFWCCKKRKASVKS